MAQVKERGGGGEERKETPSPCALFHFFGCSFISRAALVVNVCQNREARSSVFLCSETKRRRLLRRLCWVS